MDDFISLKQEISAQKRSVLLCDFQKSKREHEHACIFPFLIVNSSLLLMSYLIYLVIDACKIPYESFIREHLGQLVFVSIIFEVFFLILAKLLDPMKIQEENERQRKRLMKKEQEFKEKQIEQECNANACKLYTKKMKFLIDHKYITGANNLLSKIRSGHTSTQFEHEVKFLRKRIPFVKVLLIKQHSNNVLKILVNNFEEVPELGVFDTGPPEKRLIGHKELAEKLTEELKSVVQDLKESIDNYVKTNDVLEADIEGLEMILVITQQSIERFYELENDFFELWNAYRNDTYRNQGVDEMAEMLNIRPAEVRKDFSCFVDVHLHLSQRKIAAKHTSSSSDTYSLLIADNKRKDQELSKKNALLDEYEKAFKNFEPDFKAAEAVQKERDDYRIRFEKAHAEKKALQEEKDMRIKDASHHLEIIRAIHDFHYQHWTSIEPLVMPTEDEIKYGHLLADAWCGVNRSTEKGPSVLYDKLQEIMEREDWKEKYFNSSSRDAVENANHHQKRRLPFSVDRVDLPLAHSYDQIYKNIIEFRKLQGTWESNFHFREHQIKIYELYQKNELLTYYQNKIEDLLIDLCRDAKPSLEMFLNLWNKNPQKFQEFAVLKVA